MAENETTKQVSNVTLLLDIENTKLELLAYRQLISGYTICMNLPENKDKPAYRYQRKNFVQLHGECRELLIKLKALALERNLVIEEPYGNI